MHEFDISEPVEEMDEGDLRSTLDEFMQKHEDNVEDYREVESERDDFSETVEDLEDQVADYAETEESLAGKFAEVVASETPMFDADEVADRFALGELIEKADAMGAFSLETESPETDADEEPEGEGSTFDEKPDKAPTSGGSASGGKFADQAEEDLADILG